MGSDFIYHLQDLLRHDFGDVTVRRMFGGYGLYHQGIFWGLADQDVLYVKADSRTENEFSKEGLSRFSYEKKGKTIYLNFWTVPEESLEDGTELAHWASLGYQAGVRSKS